MTLIGTAIASFAHLQPGTRVRGGTFRRFVALQLLRTAGAIWLLVIVLTPGAAQAQNSCNVGLTLTPDYQFAIGTSTGGTGYTLTLSGATVASGPVPQLALFHYDTSLNGASGVSPSADASVAYTSGRFGQGMYVQSGNRPTYPGSIFNTFEGTIEMWIAPRFNGSDAIFTSTGYTLFQFTASNGDFLTVGFDGQHTGHIVFTGANVNGQWESAYSSRADIGTWKAGEWHHVAATFSASNNHIRFYLDGVKVADNNEGHYYPPSASGGSVQIGTTTFAVDEVRISNVALSDAAIAFNAGRSAPFANNEVLLPLANVSPGQLTYSVIGCGSASYGFSGVPISNLSPPSGLLPPGGIPLVFDTSQPTTCRYSLGSALDYASMQLFDTGPATTAHSGVLSGLSTDARALNKVYLRCASDPSFVQTLNYRVVAAPTGSFPRIGSIWLGEYLNQNRPDLAKKIQLFFGPNGMIAAEANALRASNPDVLILPSIQVDDDFSLTLPETYYLHDVHGNRVSDWCSPPSFVYNMTRPEVADYVAQQAYQTLAQSNWAFDGLFFDSFSSSYPATLIDCHGNSVQIDANGDGNPDGQAQLNAAWAAGMYRVVNTFHSLAPGAYVAGHVLEGPAQAASLAAFNGTSIEFYQQNVREGRASFAALQDLYASWEGNAVRPAITMMQSAPPNQIAYGYGYYPLQVISPALATFAQSYYPNMRFGLALTLMGDGFFAHDFGDLAPNALTAWWYDEYDLDLGTPLGPPTMLPPQVYRRDFTKGVVLLNGSSDPQTIALEPGFHRFEGAQAPRYQYIVDDAGTAFTTTGGWSTACSTADVRAWVLNPPYYHAWAGTCHQLDSAVGSAQWDLALPADGSYAIQVWLPAAPNAGSWTKNAIYEVVANGAVVSSTSIDQTIAASGDGWHTVATGVSLTAGSGAFLRVHNGGSGSLIADAAYLTSAARYNDGSPVDQVTLGAFDGILLQRDSAIVELRDVIEFYNASLDHYFITYGAQEISDLDTGVHKGWTRTTKGFKTYTTAQAGTSPVCRFYIPPALGDSHFFGRGQKECDDTAAKFPTFDLEDPAFMQMFLPVAGVCPANTTEVYRVFSNRADANHRYMTDPAIRDQMAGKGWTIEGDGPHFVVMCAPQ